MSEPGGISYDKAEEIGKIVKLSAKTIYRIAASDPSFPCTKIGGSLRFPRDKVLRWLAQRTQGK
jgi:predicted DNA-binding transcriptional regulator AlpA